MEEDLDRDSTLEGGIEGTEHRGHAAPADGLFDLVPGEPAETVGVGGRLKLGEEVGEWIARGDGFPGAGFLFQRVE